MKVAYIHTYFPHGGGEKVTIDIANQLLKDDSIELYVFARTFFKERMIPIAKSERFHVLAPDSSGSDKSFLDFICRCVKEHNIDVAVSVGVNIKGLPEGLQAAGCKAVFANHGMPFWEVRHKRMVALRLKNRGFWGMLAYYLLRYIKYEKTQSLENRFDRLYLDNITKYDAYLVLCEDYKIEIVNRLKAGRDKIYFISNMQMPQKNVCYDKKKQFLYVGRLSYGDKRVDRLIQAWKQICGELTDWELLIVGDGKEAKRLQDMSEGLERIKFEGFQKDVDKYYRTASALCLVSNHDCYPLCLMEAQANGVVPIAMECSAGVRCIVAPSGQYGFLVPNGDVEEFAGKMLEFARLSEEEKMQLRHNVVQKTFEYSPERIGNQWKELFAKLIAHK